MGTTHILRHHFSPRCREQYLLIKGVLIKKWKKKKKQMNFFIVMIKSYTSQWLIIQFAQYLYLINLTWFTLAFHRHVRDKKMPLLSHRWSLYSAKCNIFAIASHLPSTISSVGRSSLTCHSDKADSLANLSRLVCFINHYSKANSQNYVGQLNWSWMWGKNAVAPIFRSKLCFWKLKEITHISQ